MAAGQQAAQSPDLMAIITSLLEKVGYIIAFYFLFKSVPASYLKSALDEAAVDAETTETPVDDLAVRLGRVIVDAMLKAQGGLTTDATNGRSPAEADPLAPKQSAG